MRLLAVSLLALGLAACTNRVISYEPLFARDKAAEDSIRRGVWAAPETGCSFDPERPVQTWPDCANASVVDGRSFSSREFLAGGEPLIVQSRFWRQGKPPHYGYAALLPTSRDSKGRATALAFWFVECGLPDVVGQGDKREVHVTRTPLPGLAIEGDNCIAHTSEAVRNAARATRAWTTPYRLGWIRRRSIFDRTNRQSAWNADPLGTLKKAEESPAAPADWPSP